MTNKIQPANRIQSASDSMKRLQSYLDNQVISPRKRYIKPTENADSIDNKTLGLTSLLTGETSAIHYLLQKNIQKLILGFYLLGQV